MPPRFTVTLVCTLLLVTGLLHAAPSATHTAIVERVVQKLAREHPDNPVQHRLYDNPEERGHFIARTRLDARLLEHHPHIQISALSFTQPYTAQSRHPPDDSRFTVSTDEQILGVITLTYPSPAIARHQAARLPANGPSALRQRAFGLFTHGVIDNTLVVVFTELFDQRLMGFLTIFAESLAVPAEPDASIP